MVQKMVRTCFGTNNTDNCARVCHSATVAGLAKTLGSGAMTNPIHDITHDVDCILLVGSNPEEGASRSGHADPSGGKERDKADRRGSQRYRPCQAGGYTSEAPTRNQCGLCKRHDACHDQRRT